VSSETEKIISIYDKDIFHGSENIFRRKEREMKCTHVLYFLRKIFADELEYTAQLITAHRSVCAEINDTSGADWLLWFVTTVACF
jgi:hypothetical protein